MFPQIKNCFCYITKRCYNNSGDGKVQKDLKVVATTVDVAVVNIIFNTFCCLLLIVASTAAAAAKQAWAWGQKWKKWRKFYKLLFALDFTFYSHFHSHSLTSPIRPWTTDFFLVSACGAFIFPHPHPHLFYHFALSHFKTTFSLLRPLSTI